MILECYLQIGFHFHFLFQADEGSFSAKCTYNALRASLNSFLRKSKSAFELFRKKEMDHFDHWLSHLKLQMPEEPGFQILEDIPKIFFFP